MVVVELGQITPPVGINLFVVDSIARVGIGPVIRGVIPYFYIFGIFLAMLLSVAANGHLAALAHVNPPGGRRP